MKFISIVVFVTLFIIGSLFVFTTMPKDTIKIGLLYSKSGTMATEERVVGQMIHFGVEQLNHKGGLLSQEIEIIEYDGASNPKQFAQGAQYLINQGVKSIFGCWTSASRKAIIPIIEKSNTLLFYPVQYEGFENSKNIIYLGLSANQQLNPTVTYIKQHYGKRIFVVGSDYIYPRMGFAYLQELSQLIGIDIVGSEFIALGSQSLDSTIERIKQLQPDAIINMLNGTSNIAFFHHMSKNQKAKSIPIFSTSIDESRLPTLNFAPLHKSYITSSYFKSINNKANIELKKALQERFGKGFIPTESAYNAYLGLQLWTKALQNASTSSDIEKIKAQLKGESLKSITGIIYLDRNNNHLHKTINIGKLNSKSIDIVWSSQTLVKPYPFPTFKTQKFWLDLQKRLVQEWNGNWQKPLEESSNE